MKKISSKVFCNVISNVVIVSLIALVFCAGFAFNTLSTAFFQDNTKPIYHGNKEVKKVSLMINVYWGTEFIEPMLTTLDKYDVKVTFFVGGSWVAKNTETFLKIVTAGHEIGNHGYFHKDHARLDYDGNYNEIAVTHKLVKELTGIEMFLFAPPSGSFATTTLKVADELNYQTIMWSKDTIDWRDKDENLVLARATKNLENGDLILMHPTQHTLNALENILIKIKQNEFSAVRVSENINFQ